MITALYASALACLFFILTFRVGLYRIQNKIDLGTDSDPILERRIRAHGNFSEYVPFALVLMILLEIQGSAALTLHFVGILLLNARLFHAYGLSQGVLWLRMIGQALMMLTLALLMGLNGYLYFF